MNAILTDGLRALGLDPSRAPILEKYGTLLLEGNRVTNLTAITDPDEVARLHMLDCAAVAACVPLAGKRVLDVGTGAGFPGLVLRAVEPSIRLTLMDSLGKRTDWLRETAPLLGGSPVTVIHGRAEEYGRETDFRERFDIVTSRAVADLRMLAELCLPFAAVGGLFLAMKSGDCAAEKAQAAHAIAALGGTLREDRVYSIPGTAITRRIVVMEKTAPTPTQYPRRFARIRKNPL
ncbi:MAG TPA: 16S rRNA (guanine(527)-N(7))-methyltransferase RsmG [Candidatus Onthomonas avicola]|nr:16S rRNA (guanine(527)-N(7))-methyltransferase RsmG [Candidatus Onthomonas avicola]